MPGRSRNESDSESSAEPRRRSRSRGRNSAGNLRHAERDSRADKLTARDKKPKDRNVSRSRSRSPRRKKSTSRSRNRSNSSSKSRSESENSSSSSSSSESANAKKLRRQQKKEKRKAKKLAKREKRRLKKEKKKADKPKTAANGSSSSAAAAPPEEEEWKPEKVRNEWILDDDEEKLDEHGNPIKREEINFATTGLLGLEDQFEREGAMRREQEAKTTKGGLGGPSGGLGGGGPGGKHSSLGDGTNFRFQDVEQLEKLRKGVGLPADARVPDPKEDGAWRIFIFQENKDSESKTAHLNGKAQFMFGKDRSVVDIPTDHPTCSKQHAVIHFRQKGAEVVPYLMDLGSTNGTKLNGDKIESSRYYELLHEDNLQFAMSSRVYVVMKMDPKKKR